jgi:hypothetical protein
MATQLQTVAEALVKLDKFKSEMESLLESGRLEIMHRALVLLQNLVTHGGAAKDAAVSSGLVAFCDAYAASVQSGQTDLEFSDDERALLPVTADIAKKVVRVVETN